MKIILNGLLAIGLSSTPAFNLAANKINQLKLSNVNYQPMTVNYNITPSNNTYFKKWLNPVVAPPESNWDKYLHAINVNRKIEADKLTHNVVPEAEIGGGMYLNLASDKKNLNAQGLQIVNNKEAIGSYIYHNITKTNEQPFHNGSTSCPSGLAGPTTKPSLFNHGWNSHYAAGMSTLTQKSGDSKHTNSMNFLQGFLTTELNYWYYTTFSQQLKQTVSDYQLNMQTYQKIHNYYMQNFSNLIKLEFGGRYNTEKTTVSYNKGLSVGLSIAGLLAGFIPKFGDILGFLFGVLGLALDHGFVTYSSVTNHFRFISQSLTLNNIDQIMSSILGDGSTAFPAQSVIKNFLSQYRTYPDHLTLKNLAYGVSSFKVKAHEETKGRWYSKPTLHPHGSSSYYTYSWAEYIGRAHGYNEINLKTLEPFLNFSIKASKAPPNYSSEKKVLDNPLIGDKTSPITIDIGGNKQILPSDWQRKQIITLLNLDWGDLGGLVDSLIPYVSYEPVKIIYNQPTLCEMYLPILGFTKDHPRYFYIEGD